MNGIGCDPQQHVFEPGERFYPDTLAGSHEAPQDRRGLTALVAAKEGPIATTNRHTADGSFGGIMPTPGLCRAEILWMLRSGRISDPRDCETRHNHRPSKKARSESVGRKRSGTAPDGAACASAFSLSCISAWR